MPDCIFCKIVTGDLPSYKVYEDDNILAFLDITPVVPGHTMVITKKHYDTLLDLPASEASQIISVVQKIAPAILAATGSEGFNFNLNNGAVAGQVINHVHFHIVPRKPDDGLKLWPGQAYPDDQAQEILDKIKSQL